ncbi:sigma-70 family RNA polymerase sigma factor [Candidatus Woesearchaeota archaeon]|nr:sigma-70 family RNA polymerase sigma factor [Candidatus Woesearchaeota archaeon]
MIEINKEKEILDKLSLLVKLTAASVVDEKDFKEQVRLLSSVGLTPKEISEILGKSSNNVSVTLNYLKKKKV